MVIYVLFLRDVACQKLLNSVNVSRSYSQNNTGTVFLRHGVHVVATVANKSLNRYIKQCAQYYTVFCIFVLLEQWENVFCDFGI